MAMRMRSTSRNACAIILALFLSVSYGMFAPGTGDGVAIVVRPDVPVDNLSLGDIKKLLLGDRQFWNPSLRVTLLISAPGSHERDIVLKTIYQMSEAQFRQYWIAKVFRAEAAAGPRIVYSSEMAAELAASIPGAVAFVDAGQVPRGLKVLKIDGRLPADKDYPLR